MDRKEAIEIIIKNYPHVGISGSKFESALRELIPELKESEDEKIRKFLVKHVSEWIGCIEHDLKISSKDVESEEELAMFKAGLAYLEKQKDEGELGFIEGKMEGVRQTCQEIKDAMSLFEPKDLTPFEFTFRDYIDSAIRYCLAGEGYQQYIKEWAADLLNLEKQKEQKPTEWSEEDENYYDTIVRKLQVIGDDSGLTLNQIDFLDKHRPQPHWKPSEEQMKCLGDCVNRARISYNSSTNGYDDYPALSSLYNDLKSL